MARELLPNEVQFVKDAAAYLESPSLLMRLAETAGKPFAMIVHGLEKVSPDLIQSAVDRALRSAMDLAVQTIPENDLVEGTKNRVSIPMDINEVGTSAGFWHNLSVGVTGTAGGFFGLLGMPIELPITTTIMFRSIATIAKEFGEDLSDPTVRLQCLSVFCLGGPSAADNDLDSTYFTTRSALEATIAAATKFVAGKTAEEIAAAIQKGSAPLLVNLLAKIASRFNVAVSEKFVAQALPIAGAVGGATINVAFMDHFNRVARFHFGIRRLEKQCGVERVQIAYRKARGQ